MVKPWKTYDVIFWFSWVLITISPHIFNLAQDKLTQDNANVLFWKHILTFKHPYFYIVLAVFFVVSVIWGWKDKRVTSKYTLENFLEFLHTNYLPHHSGGKNPDCRITVFVPGRYIPVRGQYLKFYARSGLPRKSMSKWSITQSELEKYDGVVGFAWAREYFIAIDDLPDYDGAIPEDKNRYCKEAFVTEERINQLSWKARSFRCLVIKDKSGQKVGALMMESKNPDGLRCIQADTLQEAAKILQCFFP